jgi:hypothetical protein
MPSSTAWGSPSIILFGAVGFAPRIPLDACGETRTAPAADTRSLDCQHHGFRCALRDRLGNGQVAVPRDVSLDAAVGDCTAVVQRNFDLLLKKIDIVDAWNVPAKRLVVESILFKHLMIHQMRLKDAAHILRIQFHVEGALRQDEHHRPNCADAHAACFDYADFSG